MKQHEKPNKLDEYQLKMIERDEMNKLNSYNPFGRPGNGAPLDNKKYMNNSIIVNREDEIKNFKNSENFSSNHNDSNNMKNVNSTNNNHYNNNNINNTNLFPSSHVPNNLNNIPPSSRINSSNHRGLTFNEDIQQQPLLRPNYGSRHGSVNIINGNQRQHFPIDYNHTNYINNHDSKTSRILNNQNNSQSYTPKLSGNQEIIQSNFLPFNDRNDKQQKVINYQNELRLQIEEKKRKADEEKRKEIELDLAEEEKYKQFLQKKKQQEEEQKNKRSKN